MHDDEGLAMKIDYDPEANAAYITLGEPLRKGQAAFQSDLIETPLGRGQIILDFDARVDFLASRSYQLVNCCCRPCCVGSSSDAIAYPDPAKQPGLMMPSDGDGRRRSRRAAL